MSDRVSGLDLAGPGIGATMAERAAAPSFAGLAALHARIVERYRPCGVQARSYVRAKLRHDPVNRAVLDRAADEPLGEVADLGCGRGQLGLSLLEAGLASRVLGFDWDAAALADAEQAAAGLVACYQRADLRHAAIPPADTVLLIDVLLQMPEEAQLDLIARVGVAARRRVLVRAFDPARGWRSRVGWAVEGGLWAAGRYRRAAIRPLPPSRLAALLERHGFQVTIEPCWGWTPLPNVLLDARRHGAASG